MAAPPSTDAARAPACSVRVDGAVGVLTLDRPDRGNVLDAEMLAGATAALRALAADRVTRVAVLTGAGRAFCLGADLADLEAASSGATNRIEGLLRPWVSWSVWLPRDRSWCWLRSTGQAAGAGLALALGCEVRLISERAPLTTPTGGSVFHRTAAPSGSCPAPWGGRQPVVR